MKKNLFTQAAIKNYPLPEKGRVEIKDPEIKGLRVRISKTGRKTFEVYKWFRSKPVRIKIGEFPAWNVKDARAKAKEILTQLDQGVNPNKIKRQERQAMTLAEMFDVFVKRRGPHLREKTLAEYRRQFDRHVARPLGKRPLKDINRVDIAALVTRLGRKRPYEANRVLSLISTIFGRAIEYGLYDDINPCTGIRRQKEQRRDRFLQPDELPRFFKALEPESKTIRDFFMVLLLTGARKSNVLSMRWRDLDMDSRVWLIPGSESKNGEPLRVVLSDAAVKILQNRMMARSSFFVFPGKGKCGHYQDPKRAWERICKRAGITNLRMHDLRRTLGSYQAMTGAPLPVIGKSLRYKNSVTTEIYARLNLDQVRESIEKATAAMMGNRK